MSDILTGRINLKRLTAYLLDGVTPSSANLFDRDVVKSSKMEVELIGGTIPVMGTVIIEGNGALSQDQYIVTDRVTGTNYAISIYDGNLMLTSTASAASAEPIVEDTLIPGTYWKIFVSDGQIGIESVVTIQDDQIVLKDAYTLGNLLLAVSNGNAGITEQTNSTEIYNFTSEGIVVGDIDFTNINRITASGISNGFLRVRAVSNIGQPINQMYNVADNMPVRFYAQSGRIRMLKQGQDKIAKYKIMTEPNADIQDKDMIYTVSGCFGLTYGQIDFVEAFYDFDGITHHIEAEIVDL